MNILVPYKWLTEIADTKLDVERVSELLTLRSSSVEEISEVEGDDVMEIEVTPNRGDALSVLGIARELFAILQVEDEKTKFINPLNEVYSLDESIKGDKELRIKIADHKLVPRFFSNIQYLT